MSSRRRSTRASGLLQPDAPPAKAAPVGPPVTGADVHRDTCARWRPHAHAVRIFDSKRRAWLVYDREGLDTDFDRIVPLGSQDWGVRVFWREDHVRVAHFSSQHDGSAMRSMSRDLLLKQLRHSERVDEREGPMASASANLQHVYDMRRGMGRR